MSRKGVRGSQKPGFVLPLRQHHLYPPVVSNLGRTLKDFRRKITGTVVIGVEQDEDAAIRSSLAGGKLDVWLDPSLV